MLSTDAGLLDAYPFSIVLEIFLLRRNRFFLEFLCRTQLVYPDFLIGIGQPAHARHDTKHVVVRREDIDRRRVRRANSVVRDREEERRVINTR